MKNTTYSNEVKLQLYICISVLLIGGKNLQFKGTTCNLISTNDALGTSERIIKTERFVKGMITN